MRAKRLCGPILVLAAVSMLSFAPTAWPQENEVQYLQRLPWSYNDDPPLFWTPDQVVAEGKTVTVPHPRVPGGTVHLTLELPDAITNGHGYEIVFTVSSDTYYPDVHIMEWNLFGDDSAVVDQGTNGVHLVKRIIARPAAGQDWRWEVEAIATPCYRDNTSVKTYTWGEPRFMHSFAVHFGWDGPHLFAGIRYLPPTPPPKVRFLSPAAVPNAPESGYLPEPCRVIVGGQDFQDGATVAFGPGIQVTPVRFESSAQMVVDISGYRNLPEGSRDVVVTNPDGQKGTGTNSFYVSSLVVKPIEINQGVPMDCTAAKPGVADHNTVVRVKVECRGPAISAGADKMTGWLHVSRDRKPLPGSPFAPVEPLRVLPANTPFNMSRRFQAKDALGFVFNHPNALAEGTYDFQFEFNPRQPSMAPTIYTNASDWYLKQSITRSLSSRVLRQSQPSRAMRIAVLVEGNQPADVVEALSYFNVLRAAYPVSSSLVSATYQFSPLVYVDEDATMAALADWLVQHAGSNSASYTHVILFTRNPALTDLGLSDCWRFRYIPYLWEGFYCKSHAVVIKLRGPGTRDTVAHEIGHNFLLGDTYQNPSATSENNPCDLAQCQVLGDGCPVEDGHLDTINMTVSTIVPNRPDMVTSIKRDFMGNAVWPSRWIDRRTWDFLYGVFNSPAAALSGMRSGSVVRLTQSQEYLRVAGIINTNDQVTALTCHRFGQPMTEPIPPAGPYAVELLDAGGQRLGGTHFGCVFGYAGDHPRVAETTRFSVALPYPAGTARIRVTKDGRELASRSVSSHAPTVRVLAPNGGETLNGQTSIQWAAADADGDVLTYTVFYSRDGLAWDPLATEVTGTSIPWDTRMSPGSNAARIRVVANDGVNAGSDESDGTFAVASKPPLLFLSPLPDGTVVTSDQGLWLQGFGYDLEDGELPDTALTFRSDRDGVLGQGQQLWIPRLSEGPHLITLEGVDKDNQSQVTTRTLTVTPPVVPGPTLNIVSSNRFVILSWPAETGGFQLQSTPALVSGQWQFEAVSVPGQATIAATNTNRFFRLMKP